MLGARVQGEGAVEELVRALRLVNRLRRVDLCILGRGGGAREDLAAFNSEAVCRALADVRVPTISAVGHEVDISLTDLVADVRAATPSAAAELAVPDRRDVLRLVDDLSGRLAAGLTARTRLASARLARTADRLQAAIEVGLQRRRSQTERLAVQLDALSPLRVLSVATQWRGQRMGECSSRKPTSSPNLPFQLRVADGDVRARVE